MTRGCPRQCEFCIVGKKEGCRSVKVANLDNFWSGQKKIKLLDPNILASSNQIELLEQLVESKANVDFTQGLDARLLTDENTDLIAKCKIEMLHFAWDNEKDSSLIIHNLKEFKKSTKISSRKAKVYVLVNFDTSFEFDLERIYTLRDMGYDPYVMIFDKQNAPKEIRKLQRWVNGKPIFNTCRKFEDYKA